jgi:hypothetical protein
MKQLTDEQAGELLAHIEDMRAIQDILQRRGYANILHALADNLRERSKTAQDIEDKLESLARRLESFAEILGFLNV